MKAIIMAAGKGSRISEKIGGVPKSVLPLADNTPIIRRSIINMISRDIRPVVCVGYRRTDIYRALEGLDVEYCYNPFYSVMNNIASLWFAREYIDNEDIILSSADLYYPVQFLDMLIASDKSVAMIVDSSRVKDGDFYFKVNNGMIEEHGPQIKPNNRDYEYMGLTLIRHQVVDGFSKNLDEYIENEMFDKYFEDLVIGFHINNSIPIDFVDVCGHFWREFDFYEDYEAILNYEASI